MKMPDMAKENNFLLREAAKSAQMGYYDHLSAGGKGDPAEERWIEALNAGADAITTVAVLESRLAQAERERDAAVVDICNAKWMLCHVCKNYYRPDPAIRHYACKEFGEFSEFLNPSDFAEDGYDFPSLCGKFKWRGVCPENTKEEV